MWIMEWLVLFGLKLSIYGWLKKDNLGSTIDLISMCIIYIYIYINKERESQFLIFKIKRW